VVVHDLCAETIGRTGGLEYMLVTNTGCNNGVLAEQSWLSRVQGVCDGFAEDSVVERDDAGRETTVEAFRQFLNERIRKCHIRIQGEQVYGTDRGLVEGEGPLAAEVVE